jgi:hypothetical protein
LGLLEPLEVRTLMAAPQGNIAMLSLTALRPQNVQAQYRVDGSLAGPVTLGIYRSTIPSFSSTSLLVGQATLQGANLTAGTHQATVSLAEPLDIDPSEKFVLAVADPANQVAETSKADNIASFRTWIVGAVTHGYEPTGQFPSWVQTTADALKAEGYDATIAFNWAALSALPAAGAVPLAATEMTATINQEIAALPVHPGDVVDVHLIGHSRGGDVVSLVAGMLDHATSPLAGGYLKLTLLDPHPALNGPVAYFSASNGPIGTLTRADYLAFQAAANDPPLVIPAVVNSAEVFYQQTTVPDAILPDEHFLLPWGDVPAGGGLILLAAGLSIAPGIPLTQVSYYNLTGIVNSHEGVHDYYLQHIVPLLATATPLPITPSPVPAAPTTGGSAFSTARAGQQYETRLLRSNGIPAPVTSHLLRSYSRLNLLLSRRRFGAAGAQINKMGRFLDSQSGRGIPSIAVDYLQGQLELTRILLFPHPPLTIAVRARG